MHKLHILEYQNEHIFNSTSVFHMCVPASDCICQLPRVIVNSRTRSARSPSSTAVQGYQGGQGALRMEAPFLPVGSLWSGSDGSPFLGQFLSWLACVWGLVGEEWPRLAVSSCGFSLGVCMERDVSLLLSVPCPPLSFLPVFPPTSLSLFLFLLLIYSEHCYYKCIR